MRVPESLNVSIWGIEGGEYEAFLSPRNDVLRRIRSIALEYHPDVENFSITEMLRFLTEAGFRVTKFGMIEGLASPI
jgi:hypothetical protein